MKPVLFGIEEEVEKKLRDAQAGKEFRDAGERVKGSKKEKRAYKSIIASSDLGTLEEDEATASELVVKDRVWPKYDPQVEMDKGVSAGCAFLKTKLRAAFSAKPFARTKEARRIYVGFAEKFQQLIEKCMVVYDIDRIWNAVQQWKSKDIENILFVNDEISEEQRENLDKSFPNWKINDAIEKTCSTEFVNLLNRYRSKSAQKTWELAISYEPVTAEQAQKNLDNWNVRNNSQIESYEQRIREYRSASLSELRQLKRGWKGVPGGMEDFRRVAINYMIRKIEELKVKLDNLPKELQEHEADWSWSQPGGKKKTGKTTELFINQGKPLDFIKRTGGLEITAVSEEEIISQYGFRAVEFGNAIRDAEAKEHVRHFLGACSDLFEVLNYDAKAINGLGGLAIAFGSRGSGKASATYYPLRRIINITNKRGDGAVAHEWSHYLDNMLYRLFVSDGSSNEPFATAHLNQLRSCATTNALRSIMQFIMRGDGQYKPVLMRFFRQDKTRYRINGSTVEEALADLKVRSSYLFQDYYSNAMRGAVRVFGWLASHFEKDYVDVEVMIHRSSAYYHYSSLMGSPYWRDPVELFARAFETYAFDKLIVGKMFNNYLVSGEYFNHSRHIYPYGEEREKLFSLYDDLINALREDAKIAAFIPHTQNRTEEYIVLDSDEENEKVESGVVALSSLNELLRLEINLYKVS